MSLANHMKASNPLITNTKAVLQMQKLSLKRRLK